MDKRTSTDTPVTEGTIEVTPTPVKKAERVKRFIRNTAIATAVVFVVLVGAGVAYTWWMGKTPAPVVVLEEQSTPPPRVEATPVAENSPVSASVQSLTSPVLVGDNVLLTVKTRPDATCTIKVEYNKIPSNDSGLVARVADDFGIVTWSWTVDQSAPVGKWPVTVTCVLGERSAVVVGDLVVEAE